MSVSSILAQNLCISLILKSTHIHKHTHSAVPHPLPSNALCNPYKYTKTSEGSIMANVLLFQCFSFSRLEGKGEEATSVILSAN